MTMRKKRFLLVALTVMLFLPSFLVDAAPNNNTTSKTETSTNEDTSASKDEVVYATLSAHGSLQEIYIVNIFDVVKPGTIIDFGHYSSLKNLTDLSELEQQNNTVKIDAPKGKFYYQGNMDKNSQLPWNINISYYLNGVQTTPEELAGQDGRLQIKIETTANEKVDRSFYENFLVQIALTLSPEVFNNIEAPDAMIANAGKNKRVNFTVMPEQDGDFLLEADVVNFEMDGVEISAVPASMALDVEVDGFTDDIKTLADAIAEIHNGVTELKSGVSALNSGVKSLRDGSAQYQDGMNEISGASSELVAGSAEIDKTLSTISSSISEGLGALDSSEWDLGELEDLPKQLSELSTALRAIADELEKLDQSYSEALSILDEAIKKIPTFTITEEQIEELYNSGADKEVVDRLLETYYASQSATEAYDRVKERFQQVDGTISDMNGTVREWSGTIQTVSTELENALENMDMLSYITEFEEGMATFSKGYGEFHAGLVSYTNGVNELARSYRGIYSGIVEVSNGTNELNAGVGELQGGTKKLYEATNDLPEQMRDEIDKMLAEYDKSDYEPVSFVSAENTNINSVQFVMKTKKIKKDEQDNKAEVTEEKKGFWAKLLKLFGRS